MNLFESNRIIKYLKMYNGGNFLNLVTEYFKYKKWNKKLNSIDKSGDFKEYSRYYSSINYKNKIVVDWGADIGSSAIYFLSKGASKVYCYEIDKNKIKKFNVVKGMPEFKQFDLSNRIKYNPSKAKGDILKMDIEGSEAEVLSEKYIDHFSKFIIALHPQQISSKKFLYLSNMLKNKGARVYGRVMNSKGLAEVIYIKQ